MSGKLADVVAMLSRKLDRVHPTNRQDDLGLLVKMTYGEALALLEAGRQALLKEKNDG